jgi:hypothetical protein
VRGQHGEQDHALEGGRILHDPNQPVGGLRLALLIEMVRFDPVHPRDRGLGHRRERRDQQQQEQDDYEPDVGHGQLALA